MAGYGGKVLEVGTVIRIPERKHNIYKIVDAKWDKCCIHRCENDPKNGYPLASDRTTYVISFDHYGIEVIAKGTVETFDPAFRGYQRGEGYETSTSYQGVPVESLKKNVFIPAFVVEAFQSLENELSPENLFCDGEISRSAAMMKKAKIDRLWSALENYIGKKVRA